jgi:hypothetical protein
MKNGLTAYSVCVFITTDTHVFSSARPSLLAFAEQLTHPHEHPEQRSLTQPRRGLSRVCRAGAGLQNNWIDYYAMLRIFKVRAWYGSVSAQSLSHAFSEQAYDFKLPGAAGQVVMFSSYPGTPRGGATGEAQRPRAHQKQRSSCNYGGHVRARTQG